MGDEAVIAGGEGLDGGHQMSPMNGRVSSFLFSASRRKPGPTCRAILRRKSGSRLSPGRGLGAERLCRLGEPARGVAIDQRGQYFADSGVVRGKPGDLLVIEQLAGDEM